MTPPLLPAITVFERGWLSSNNVLLHDDDGAVLVDASHVLHAPQTVALLRGVLAGQALRLLVNTHLHSDHCGGNATLQREFGCTLCIPPGQWQAVQRWDQTALSFAPTGQRCERFVPDAMLRPGDVLRAGTRRWQVLAAPGHDPHSVMLFDAADGVLISADALWQRGFGIIFPELDGEAAFDDQAAVLDLIDSLQPRAVIPGHGAPFSDVAGALREARSRLAMFRAQPERHARHALKALVKYHLLEEQQQDFAALLRWFEATPLYGTVWRRLGEPAGSMAAFGEALVRELVAARVLALREGVVWNS